MSGRCGPGRPAATAGAAPEAPTGRSTSSVPSAGTTPVMALRKGRLAAAVGPDQARGSRRRRPRCRSRRPPGRRRTRPERRSPGAPAPPPRRPPPEAVRWPVRPAGVATAGSAGARVGRQRLGRRPPSRPGGGSRCRSGRRVGPPSRSPAGFRRRSASTGRASRRTRTPLPTARPGGTPGARRRHAARSRRRRRTRRRAAPRTSTASRRGSASGRWPGRGRRRTARSTPTPASGRARAREARDGAAQHQ